MNAQKPQLNINLCTSKDSEFNIVLINVSLSYQIVKNKYFNLHV